MRKILLLTIASIMALGVSAKGLGDGTSKANAVDFNWVDGHKPALSAGSWYCVSLDPMKAQANDPTLALYLTNLTNENANVTVNVEATVSFMGQTQTGTSKLTYNINGSDYRLWSVNKFTADGRELSLKQLMDLGLTEVYLQLTANKQIALSAKVYETEDIVDDACVDAVDFHWAGVSVAAGEKWFRLNLNDVKSSNKELKFVITNNGATTANVSFDMSLDCPASAVIEKDWTIAAGADKEDEFGRIFLDVLTEDYVFLKLTNDQPLTLRVEEEVVVVDPSKYADFNCATAPELILNQALNLTAGKHVYKIKREELIAARDFATEFTVTNLAGSDANLTVETAFACPVTSVVEQALVIGAGATVVKPVKDNILSAVNSEWVYLRFITDQDLNATIGMRNTSPCANATVFDWTTGASLQAGESNWYEMDITPLKQDKKHLYLGFTNHSSSVALVSLEIALDCNGTILPITLPVPAGLSVGQVIDYQLLSRSPLNRIYVGVSTDSHIELSASVKDAIAADQTPCLNAINPEHGVEYKHEAGSTGWYTISLDLLKSTDSYSSLYLANMSGKTAHVTFGVVPDCQYTVGTTVTLPIPAGLNLGVLGPNILGRLISELAHFQSVYNKVDSKEVYMQITTDQDVHFGLDVTNATTNPCLRDDLITFDWTTGATVNAGPTTWYDLDIKDVKSAGKHVKLTFTNHTDSIVWVATVLSLDCPAKLTMPMILPVPAGMSVDKFIPYNYFAIANLDNIYLGVKTQGELELAATATDAIITPSADCTNAVTVESGVEYSQAIGTQWYKFPMSLVEQMTTPSCLTFKNQGDHHATITTGFTVGCEYEISMLGSVKVPKYLNMSLNVPKSVVAAARKMIDPSVSEIYLQLTTNQPIAFSINNQTVNVNACADAVNFDWDAWEENGLQLEANQDVWYKVGLSYPLQKLKEGEDVVLTIANPNNASVDVDFAISPSCPTVVTLNHSITIPADIKAQKVLPYADIVRVLSRIDNFVYNTESDLWLERVETYVFYNQLNKVLAKLGHKDYIPYSKVESLLDQYGMFISFTGVYDLFTNYEKYLSKAEIKDLLTTYYAEYVNVETAIAAFDKYGDYIPYVDAEKILANYDKLIPYAGGAAAMLNKCKTYISKEDIKSALAHCKQYVPFEEIKQLLSRIENKLPELGLFVNIKSEGDIIIEPDTIDPIEDMCAEAILYSWGTDIVLHADEEAWYKLAIKDIRGEDCTLKLAVTNSAADSVFATANIYDECPVETPFISILDLGIGGHETKIKEVSSDKLPSDVDTLYLYVKPTGSVVVNLSSECAVLETKYDTITALVCDSSEYISPITSKSHLIVAADASSLTWNDTLHISATLDSVFTFIITPIVAPQTMTDSILALIYDGMPLLTQGKMPNVPTDSIINYYKEKDTEAIADVLSATWTTGKVDCEATEHTMTLVIEDACGNEIKTTHKFPVQARPAGATEVVHICAGEKYPWHGGLYDITDVYTKTLQSVDGCDSIVTLELYVHQPTYSDTTATISNLQLPFDWHGIIMNAAGDSSRVVGLNADGCDSIVRLHLIVNDFVIEKDTITDFVCDGNEYIDPITGEKHIISSLVPAANTWNTTVHVNPFLDRVTTFIITPIVAPEEMTLATLEAINAVPVLAPGCVPSVDASILAIKDYYDNNDNDTIADVISVSWDNITTAIDCDATEHQMNLTVEAGCDNIITVAFIFPVALQTTTVEVVENACVSYTWAQTGKTYEASGVYYDTIASQITGCDSIYHELTLTIWPDVVNAPLEKKTICYGESYSWNGQDCDEAKTYTYTEKNILGCDSVIYTLELSILPDVVEKETEKKTICFGESYSWNGQDCNETKIYTHVVKNALGCDSIIYKLNLTVLPDVVEKPLEKHTICFGESYSWNGQDCNETKIYTHVEKNALDCDSIIYKLDLTVLPDVVEKPLEKHTICYGTSYSWHGIDCNEAKTYTYVEKNALGCDSIIYTLELTIQSQVTIPASADVLDGIVVLCGKAIDVTEANATINAHAAADPLFPAVNAIVWEEKKADGTWAPLSNNAIDGTITSVTLRYTLQTACEDITSDPFEINVETPTPENDEDMINVPVYSRYGNRLLTVDIKYIETNYGWTVVEEDITWYRVNPNGGQDEVVGSSYYLTTEDGNPLEPGSYYARITHVRVEPSDCDGELKTVITIVGSASNAPKLVPTVARPQELINLLNLDPETVSTISIYSTTGELISTFQVENLEQTTFPAAQLTGYYVVEVQTEKEKVSLRYIVK